MSQCCVAKEVGYSACVLKKPRVIARKKTPKYTRVQGARWIRPGELDITLAAEAL